MALKKYKLNDGLVAGTDEAGRGCLAGPVVAAAVILPDNFKHPILNDSKQLSASKREILKTVIEKEALSYAVAFVNEKEIDEINILNASILAMHKALDQLQLKPDFIIVDGNKFKPFGQIPHQTIVKGDAKFMSIAAASILAKTYRDAFMENLANDFPEYGWHSNKGYPTVKHRDAISKFGVTPFHRKSFQLLPKQLKLDL
ncbi:MAG: ribonuclease HII [Lutibacter sp.]